MKIKTERKSSQKSNSFFESINENAAGINIGSSSHWVGIPSDRAEKNVRSFGCFTCDLLALADWLHSCQVDTVAMESTPSLLDTTISNFRSQGSQS